MIALVNGCRMSEPQVHPSNWKKVGASLKKNWYIHYRVYDPEFEHKYMHGFLKIIKRINGSKTLEERRLRTKPVIKEEKESLQAGCNP